MRIDMERQIESEKLKNQKDEADRLERIRREEAAIKKRQAEFSALEKKLAIVLPLVNEGNLIARELKRDVVFNTKMIRVMNDSQNLMDARTEVVVRVENWEEGYYYQWDGEKFQNRLFMMRDQLNNYFEDGQIPQLDKEHDPFWDPNEPMLVGTSFLSLKNLSYMVENKMSCKILSSEGAKGIRGTVNLGYWPCASNGVDEPEDDVFCDEPHELVGKAVHFKVDINDAEDLPADLCKNSFVSYSLKYEPDTVYETEKCDGLNQKPSFNYGKVHSVDCVSDYIIDYFQSSSIGFQVWAEPQLEKKGGKINRAAASNPKKVVTPRNEKPKPTPTVKKGDDNNNNKTETKEVIVTEKAGGSSCCSMF